ncbi:MAG TPA: CapA family protein [Ignavibacteria bacterium]|nr:CapA family protein [Ignavibacteria bacterium]HMR39016.1 CapA family protein [Ignavibacteria bacterium]
MVVSVFFISCRKTDSKKNDPNSGKSDSSVIVSKTDNKKPDDSLICILGVGDLMLGTNYPSSASLPPDGGEFLLDSVKDIPDNADIVFGNLEGTFLDTGGEPKVCNTPDNCYSFRTPVKYCEILKSAGFNLLSLANNHSNDMGEEGRESTIKTLEKNSIRYAGYAELPFTIFEINGSRFGFTAFAPNYASQNINDLSNAVKVVSELKKKCDIVIVSFHGGAEGSSAVRVPGKKEIFLGEDRGNVYEFAHEVIDAGADIVIGHGPHVPRAIELYRNKIIAYSLGNFCTYGKFSTYGVQGIAPLLKVYLDKKGNFVKGKIYSYTQKGRGYPVPDPELKAAILIKELTGMDFPETGLIIEETGEIELTGGI